MKSRRWIPILLTLLITAIGYHWLFVPTLHEMDSWPGGPRLKCLNGQCALQIHEFYGQPNAFRPLKASPPFTFEPYTKNPTLPREEKLDLWPKFVSDESDAIPQKFPDNWILLGTSELTGGSKVEVFVRSTNITNEYEIKFRIGSRPESVYLMERKNTQGIPFPKREPYFYRQSRFDKLINGIIS